LFSQERIRNLVFKMIETQFKTVNEPFTFYIECQVVQTLLPCFVASFLDMDKDTSVSQESKEKYLNFIHELIKSYEEYPYEQKLVSLREKLLFSGMPNNNLFPDKIEHYQKNLRACLTKNIGNNLALEEFFEKGLKYLTKISYETGTKYRVVNLEPWPFQLFMLLSRINCVLEKLAWLDDVEFKRFALLTCLHESVNTCKGNPLILHLSLNKLKKTEFHQSRKLRLKGQPQLMKPVFMKVQDVVVDAAKELSVAQIHSIAFYEYFSQMQDGFCILDQVKAEVLTIHFALDFNDVVFWSFMSNDRWSLMQQLYKLCKRTDDCGLVPLKLAASNICYRLVLMTLTPEGKVKMSKPGEITFFPVKHCRWCGKLKVTEFRMCPECKENPEYPDINYFCSEKCETESLDKQHTEEHARFLMIKCGI